MQPDLLKLKPLKNLQQVWKEYLTFFNQYDEWKEYPCPICKAFESTKELFTIDRFSYRECFNCGTIYNSPQFDIPLDYSIYRDKLVKPARRMRQKLVEVKYSQITHYSKNKGTLLDVGCGLGILVEVFIKHGWSTVGIDPCLNTTFEEYKTRRKFDVITFFGVLEHVNNPLELLLKAKSLLRKGGIIVYEAPSADCFLMEYLLKYPFSPYRFIEHGRHLSFFSRKTIHYLCDKTKMKIVDLKTVGFDLQTITLTSEKEIIQMQDILNKTLQADHYRVYVR